MVGKTPFCVVVSVNCKWGEKWGGGGSGLSVCDPIA